MKTKVLLLYLFLSLLQNNALMSQWQTEICPVNENLNGIFVTDSGDGWIVGNRGTILSHAGSAWQLSDSPSQNNLYAVYMIDKNDGWIVGEKGTILHFSGGKWELVESPTNNTLYALRFYDAMHGMAIGELGTILIYKNNEWVIQRNNSHGNLFALSGIENEFWLGGSLESVNVPIMRLSLAGDSIPYVSYNSKDPVQSMSVLNERDGWAVGGKNTILHFDGEAWKKQSLPFTFPSLRSVYFRDKNHGISAGYEGTLLTYRNNIWLQENSGTKKRLNSVFANENCNYAIGDDGTIITSKKWTDNLSLLSDNTINLYPNPVDTHANIDIVVTEDNCQVIVSVTGLTGQTVKSSTLKLNAGIHNYVLSTSELNDGIYLLTLRQNNKTENVKLVIQH